ncbi:hypothetical protein FBZ91_11427 [Nitrospirillum viridazoti]|uniref:Uncharacterized protein n=2 Tax=Nitrospirillum TaxID=1543705 RepID=A0A248K0U9_9PROT|nr:hypothetical protein Y958_26100 [Nitrospirillum amazonense CBAmc]TWB33314.1 hypothetical protein FBZ91_11427 [Nitrospirillum amazonense]
MPAQAGWSDYGYILDVNVVNNGVYIFRSDGARNSAPGCATFNARYAVNAANPGGQALMSALTTAFALHLKVQVFGLGTCNTWGDSEDVQYIIYQNP